MEAFPSVEPPQASASFGVTRVEVSGFRSARDVALSPGPLCALVGEANAGKSNLLAAIRAVLEEVMTKKNYERMERHARRLERGLAERIDIHSLPWHVSRVGARVEFVCAPGPLGNGSQAEAAHAPRLEALVHLSLLNRGVLISPFHNMMLVSPATGARQVDRLVSAFGDVAARLAA